MLPVLKYEERLVDLAKKPHENPKSAPSDPNCFYSPPDVSSMGAHLAAVVSCTLGSREV